MSSFQVIIPSEKRTEVAAVRSAIQQAINECWMSGGGRVVVPAGEYRVSSIQLRDHVMLDMQDGCVLMSPTEEEDFLRLDLEQSRFKGKFIKYFCGVVTAVGCSDAGIRGGRIIGHGKSFWTPKDTIGETWNSTPPHYWARPFRPMTLLFHRCERISVCGTVIEDSPVYSGWISDCKDITFRDTKVLNDIYGPNTDGYHFSSCVGVLVDGCHFLTGDDSLAVDGSSSGLASDIVIRNCTFDTTVNVLRIYTGLDPDVSEEKKHSRVRNLAMHNCRVLNAAGVINVTAQYGDISGLEFFNLDINMEREGTPFFLMTDCGGISDVSIKKLNVFANGIGTIIGTRTHAISDIRVEDCDFLVRPMKKLFELDIPDPIPNYAMHHFAPCNLFIRHAHGVTIKNVTVKWQENPDFLHDMSAVTLNDADDTAFESFSAKPYSNPDRPAIWRVH
jgi:hypothetical protein